jgi:hypothetical protein
MLMIKNTSMIKNLSDTSSNGLKKLSVYFIAVKASPQEMIVKVSASHLLSMAFTFDPLR